jgi:hypothetical protein
MICSVRLGNWTCPKCKNINYPHRETCNRCPEPKPAVPGEEMDWVCAGCQNINFPHRSRCNRCQAEKAQDAKLVPHSQRPSKFAGQGSRMGNPGSLTPMVDQWASSYGGPPHQPWGGGTSPEILARNFVSCFGNDMDPIGAAIKYLLLMKQQQTGYPSGQQSNPYQPYLNFSQTQPLSGGISNNY